MDGNDNRLGEGHLETQPVHNINDTYLHLPFFSLSKLTSDSDDSQDKVKHALLEEEADDLKNGILQIHDTSPTAFMTMALLIEETQ